MLMQEKSVSALNHEVNTHFTGRKFADDSLQLLLINAAYHALRGNSDPLNHILTKAVESNSLKVRGITMWCELNLPVRIKDEAFKLNKSWVEMEVKSWDEFAKGAMKDLMAAPKFYKLTAKEKPASIWDVQDYLESVVKTLTKHGKEDVAKEISALKGAIARAA